MSYEKEYIFIFILLVFFGLRYFSKIFKVNVHFLNVATFLIAAISLFISFLQKGLYVGILAIMMGGMAYGKYFLDIYSSDKEK